jgi:hypothetical protein
MLLAVVARRPPKLACPPKAPASAPNAPMQLANRIVQQCPPRPVRIVQRQIV